MILINNYTLWPTNGQNTPKLAIAPSIFTITDPNLDPVSRQVTPIASNMILDTSHNTQQEKEMV